MGRVWSLVNYIGRQFILCNYSLGIYSQWRDPISDFNVIDIGFSYFGENDWYSHWASFHVTVLGIVFVVRIYENG